MLIPKIVAEEPLILTKMVAVAQLQNDRFSPMEIDEKRIFFRPEEADCIFVPPIAGNRLLNLRFYPGLAS